VDAERGCTGFLGWLNSLESDKYNGEHESRSVFSARKAFSVPEAWVPEEVKSEDKWTGHARYFPRSITPEEPCAFIHKEWWMGWWEQLAKSGRDILRILVRHNWANTLETGICSRHNQSIQRIAVWWVFWEPRRQISLTGCRFPRNVIEFRDTSSNGNHPILSQDPRNARAGQGSFRWTRNYSGTRNTMLIIILGGFDPKLRYLSGGRFQLHWPQTPIIIDTTCTWLNERSL